MSKTLKDLCFLTGVLIPPLALALFFFSKNLEYKKPFKMGIIYGVIFWVMLALILSMKMCSPLIDGMGDL
ncbi:MAG: hypothetical protein K2J13_00500 [Clostridia bacterium]|nr:hypothetical protein [Clostridia bacterium]